MKKKIIIIAVCIVIVAGLIFVPSMFAGNGNGMNPGLEGINANETVFSVRTEDAEIRTLQSYIEINGDIITEQQVSVVPDAGGKIVSLKVGLGSSVQKNQLLAEVDPSRPGTSYSLSPVYAPIAGTVTTTPLAVGSTVTTSTSILTISVTSDLEIETFIPEREVGQLRTGLKAEITLQAFPGEVFSATVTNVSPVVDPNSRTKKVILKFDTNDSRINTGMFARVKLNTRTYENAVTIPSDALVETRGSNYVYVLDGLSHVSLREVVPGVTVDDFLEIKSGLAAGETIIIQGQQFLTDGATVKVVNQRTQA
ncbi:efflux RND transporter periplasmic adaptor subunit [Brucepastera parasyntrophica]|uniref:efflux RND transporter periplasmic adaptor subunit n=1 Tax=Brucepastera parasyntrophica TaxID=2880008 RepID=UPI002109E6CA|nr:efflux RND transporter periplasmic adaptor subunit [Brucepastera parasyntrophica]ULQ58725.1 efflux RND transporter periplasmic adaptor subunit [Brucepastera parasyntrophica]